MQAVQGEIRANKGGRRNVDQRIMQKGKSQKQNQQKREQRGVLLRPLTIRKKKSSRCHSNSQIKAHADGKKRNSVTEAKHGHNDLTKRGSEMNKKKQPKLETVKERMEERNTMEKKRNVMP